MNTKHLIRVIALTAIIAVSVGPLFAAEKREVEAQKAAERWLVLIDAGKFAESWETAAEYFKTAVSKEKWQSTIATVRKPLGDPVSRKLKSAKYTRALPGAPDGEYVVLQFDASFVNKKAAVETVTPMFDKEGKWKVSGYFLR